jgi:hypothetical protein
MRAANNPMHKKSVIAFKENYIARGYSLKIKTLDEN